MCCIHLDWYIQFVCLFVDLDQRKREQCCGIEELVISSGLKLSVRSQMSTTHVGLLHGKIVKINAACQVRLIKIRYSMVSRSFLFEQVRRQTVPFISNVTAYQSDTPL